MDTPTGAPRLQLAVGEVPRTGRFTFEGSEARDICRRLVTLRVYNTLTGQKEPFTPMEPGKVSLYVCGPTVYEAPHLGHARCYVTWDTVVKYLRMSGYLVKHVQNYTDVDDKIIRKANESGRTQAEVAEENIAVFEADMGRLGVTKPEFTPKVTTHMAQIVALIERLIANDVAYASQGNVYFSVRSFANYGRLSHRKPDDMRSGTRVEIEDDKRDPLDFALWKSAKPEEPTWDSPWGPGRPGWHIECSAMSMSYLGDTFDIHAGGVDLVFPHHENEIAQSEGATGKPFVKYWLHNGFVQVDQEKMSKSLGNFQTVRDLLEKYDPETLRMFVLSVQYRSPINLTPDLLGQAGKRVRRFYETLRRVDRRLARLTTEGSTGNVGEPGRTRSVLYPARIADIRAGFTEAMDDDFNTAGALAAFEDAFTLMNEVVDRDGQEGTDPALVALTLRKIRSEVDKIAGVLGILQKEPDAWIEAQEARLSESRGVDTALVDKLIGERTLARADKNWARADEIRDELAAMGVTIKDGPNGTEWTLE